MSKLAPFEVASAFWTLALEQQEAVLLAFSEQQADLASQVLESPACSAGIKAKAASVKQTTSFFIVFLLLKC